MGTVLGLSHTTWDDAFNYALFMTWKNQKKAYVWKEQSGWWRSSLWPKGF